jgi:hypothetical protein
MAFGRKKNTDEGSAAPAVEVAQSVAVDTKKSGQKKRKPAELLSSVVNETAVGAAVDVMKRNPLFALPDDKGWIGLLLNVDSIGGLSQKQKNDKTKGSILELITADKIEVVATRAMLDEEYLGIVPTAGTLARMGEYSLLTEAPYYWALFISEDGTDLRADAIADTPATYAEALQVSNGELPLQGLVPQVWQWATGENQQIAEVPAEAERVLVGAGAAADADPLAGAFSFDGPDDGIDYAAIAAEDEIANNVDFSTGEVADDEPALEFDEAKFEAQFAATPGTFPDVEGEGSSVDMAWRDDDDDDDTDATPDAEAAASEGYYQYVTANRDRVVDEDEVRDTIVRRFLSNDLDLNVDLAEFEKVFATQTPAISIEIAEDPSDWLGSQIAQLTRQANAEMQLLHASNVDSLRTTFVETMALHIEKTMAVVSTDTPGTQYADLMDGARRDFEANRAQTPQEIASARQEILDRFQAAAQSRAEQAAAHARAQYEDRNRPKLDRDLADVGVETDRRVEEKYAHDRQVVLEMRSKEARVRMDVGSNRIFELLAERQAEQRDAERELLERWNGQLVKFLEENRQHDISRTMALADQLARANEVDVLKAEHKAEVKDFRRERQAREEALERDIIRIREQGVADLATHQANWEASIASANERAAGQSALVAQLNTQVTNLKAHYEAQYVGRIQNLEADKARHEDEITQMHAGQKRALQIMVLFGVILLIAGVAVGVIGGWAWAQNQALQSAPAGFAVLGSLLT